MTPPRYVVVTDLDGSLLDHHTYSFAPAVDAMDRLRELGVPLVLNTSKTRAELHALREELGNSDPFIVENGSAVFLPRAGEWPQPADTEAVEGFYCRVFGCHYGAVLAALEPLKAHFRFTGFSELGLGQLQELTGLGEAQARQALAREFSEPLVWRDSEAAKREFTAALVPSGLTTLQGGRFLHVLGEADKGRSLNWLRGYYGAEGRPVTTIALGDGPNDIAMLQAADIGVVIRSPSHGVPTFNSTNRVIVTEREGPRGWSDAIHDILDELQAADGLEAEK